MRVKMAVEMTRIDFRYVQQSLNTFNDLIIGSERGGRDQYKFHFLAWMMGLDG